MHSSKSISDSGCNEKLIAAVCKKQGKRRQISERDRCRQIQDCLDQGADINILDEDGNTILHTAVKKNYPIAVELLRRNGARTDIPNGSGDTAITLAKNLGKPKIASILTKTFTQRSQPAVRLSSRASQLFSIAANRQPSTTRNSDAVIQQTSTIGKYCQNNIRRQKELENATQPDSQLHRAVNADSKREDLEQGVHFSDNDDEINEITAFQKEKMYSAAATLTRSWPGIAYQLKHLAFTLHCALQQKDPYFLLALEMIAAEKLDDVVLLYKNNSGNQVGRFVQIKYTSDRTKRIVATQLLAASDDFSVSRYFISWRKVKVNKLFHEIEVRNIILCTNMGLDLKDLKKNHVHCRSTEEPDKSFELKSELKNDMEKTAWYKLTADKISNKKLYDILRATSDRRRLAKVLAVCVYQKKPARLDKEIFRAYHLALVEHVFNTKTKKFHDIFIENKNLSEEVQMFREVFLVEFRKLAKSSKLDSSEALTWTEIQNRFKMFDFQRNFGGETKSATNSKLPVDDYVDDVEISTFLEEFTLAVNQPNEDELNGLIRLKMDANSHFNLLNTELLDCAFQTKMWDWFVKKSEQKKGKEYFSYKVGKKFVKDMNNMVGSLITIGMNSIYCEQMKAYDVHFKSEMQRLTTFLTEDRSNSSSNRILKLVVPETTLLIALRVYDTLERIPKYRKMDSFIFAHVDSLKLSWILNTVMTTFASLHHPDLLIVDCGLNGTEQYLQTLWNPLCEIMARNVDKRMIVITQNIEDLDTRFKLCQTYHGNNDDHSFGNLRNESQKKLLGKRVTKFQGQRNETSFGELLGILDSENLRVDELKDLLEIIDSHTLVELICNDEIQIGGDLKGLEEIGAYYINRAVQRYVIIKRDILKDREIPDLLAISGIDGELPNELMQIEKISLITRNPITDVLAVSGIDRDLPGKLVEIKETSPTAQSPTKFTILDSRQAKEQFEVLCAENKHRNIHWLKKESEKYIWEKSQGDIAYLVQYRDVRESDRDNDGTTATDLSESKLAACDQPVIISDTAGMGKSAMLTYLAYEMKKNNPDLLVLKIDLNHCQDALVKARQKSSYDLDSITTAVQFLVNELLSHETNFAKKVFKRIIEKQRKVAFVFDQFDEISPTHEDTIINLLQTLVNYGTKKLFVATRPHTRATLESKLNSFSYEIQPLSSDNQEDLLTKFWGAKLGSNQDSERLKTYAKALMKKFADSIKDRRNKFTANPLQLRLMAEIFESHSEGKQENFDSCKEFVDSEVDQPKFSDKMNLIYLYKYFVEKKFDNYFKNTSSNAPSEAVKELRELRFNKFIEIHEKLALYALFDKDKVNKLLHCRRDVSYKLLERTNPRIVEERIGIITQFIDDHPHFGHQTYAEYFAAEFFSDNLTECDKNQALQEIFLADVLLARKYETMRAFINCLLSGAHIDILEGESWKFYLNTRRSAINETIFHVAAAEGNGHIIRLFLNCLDTKPRDQMDLINIKDYFGRTAVHRAVEYGYLDGIKLLVEHSYYEMNSQENDGLTALHLAAQKGELDVVKYLLDKEADINSQENDGLTALHLAAQKGELDIVKYLLCVGAKLKSQSKEGFMPLHLAAMNGNLDIVKYLLDKGADIRSRNNDSSTPLHLAAATGRLDVVKYLLYKGANICSQDNNGFTPLHRAAISGALEIVKYLFSKGAKIKSQTKDGITSLHVAAGNGKSDVVQYLLDKGAKINSQTMEGDTPLHMAVMNGKLDVVRYLLGKGADIDSLTNNGYTLLHLAAISGKLNVVKYLLDTGINIKSQENNLWTPLHLAAMTGKLDIVKYLLDKGADMNSQGNDCATPQEVAAIFGESEIVKYLLDKGATINSQEIDTSMTLHLAAVTGKLDIVKYLLDKVNALSGLTNNGWTPLHLATHRDELRVVEYLLYKRVNINSQEIDDLTILHLAAMTGKLDVVKYLLNKGVNINSQTDNGWTPLHLAAMTGKLDVIRYLLDKGANINSQEDHGWTSLHLAAYEGKLIVTEYLFNQGANINSQENNGLTPLHLAAHKGVLCVVKYLLSKGANINSETNDGLTPLDVATAANESDVVKYLLHKKAIITCQEKCNLILAMLTGQLDAVKSLLDKGININFQMGEGVTLLHVAACNGNLDMVKYLLDNGANINQQDNNGLTPLHVALLQCKFDVIKYLRIEGAVINSEINDDLTSLHQANRKDELDEVIYLPKTLANTSPQTKKSAIPLRVAMQKNELNAETDCFVAFQHMITVAFFIIVIIIIIIIFISSYAAS